MGSQKVYGSMYAYEASQLITIDAVDQYHAIIGLSAGTDYHGITFLDSLTGSITDTANNGGTLRCTDATHGLTTGQYITQTGMGDVAHVGYTRVTVIDVDTYDCDDITYNSIGDTGSWSRGSGLIVDVGHGGIFNINYSTSILTSVSNKNYKFELVKNITELDELVAERKISTGSDLGSLSAGGVVKLSGGDVLWAVVEGTTDATNLTVEHYNLHIIRI